MWKVKFECIAHRFWSFVKCWPKRFVRLMTHVLIPLDWIVMKLRNAEDVDRRFSFKFPFWFLGLVFLLLDLIGVPEIYETLADFVKWKSRCMTDNELQEAKKIFGDRINWKRVRIDERACFGPRQLGFAYVSFYIINSWNPLSGSVMIHELVHIWQFATFGSQYIPLALQAQLSEEGYNYGGIKRLTRLQERPFHYVFNFEQQAEIVEDHYRSKNGFPLQWSENGAVADYWLRYWSRRLI